MFYAKYLIARQITKRGIPIKRTWLIFANVRQVEQWPESGFVKVYAL